MRCALILTLLFSPFMPTGVKADGISDLTGRWRTVRHGALVDIAPCGDAACGTLAWIDPQVSKGNTLDIRNRNKSLRGRSLMGVPILLGFTCDGAKCRDGKIYNPDDGKTFRAHVKLISSTQLRVSGCLGPLCRSQIWTRVERN